MHAADIWKLSVVLIADYKFPCPQCPILRMRGSIKITGLFCADWLTIRFNCQWILVNYLDEINIKVATEGLNSLIQDVKVCYFPSDKITWGFNGNTFVIVFLTCLKPGIKRMNLVKTWVSNIYWHVKTNVNNEICEAWRCPEPLASVTDNILSNYFLQRLRKLQFYVESAFYWLPVTVWFLFPFDFNSEEKENPETKFECHLSLCGLISFGPLWTCAYFDLRVHQCIVNADNNF